MPDTRAVLSIFNGGKHIPHKHFPGGTGGKDPTCQCGFDPWAEKIFWRRAWQPTLVFLEYRYSPCVENPMDRGAWWATVHRVTKSWTRLKRLSTQYTYTV